MKQYQNAEDTRGRLVMSCMTPATEGTFISIDDEEAKQFRESVVEWLMTTTRTTVRSVKRAATATCRI